MTQLTKGIGISTLVTYRPEHSDPANSYFLFTYRITIVNRNPFEVKLLARHWDVFDSNGKRTVVDGEGVVGEQPVLEPGESFTYESACHLETGIGRMKGHYVMLRSDLGTTFKAAIPEFRLEVAYMLN